MEKTAAGWRVLDREAGVLTYDYSFAKGAWATTFVARMANGQLLVMSPAKGLSDEAAAELASFGEVGALVAPNGFHHLGVPEWRARFPKARCFAAAETAQRIRKKNQQAGDFESLALLQALAGPKLGVGEVQNTKCGETWLWVETARGHVWFVSDILANIPKLPGNPLIKFLFWSTNSAPGYKVFHLALRFIVKDKKATLRALAEEMQRRPPITVVPSHGPALTGADVARDTQALLAAQSR